MFAIAKLPTPILNTPDFERIFGGADGATLALDDKGLLRAVETVALPGTKFALQEKCSQKIYRVTTHEYPGDSLFVDKRFLADADASAPERQKKLPPTDEILVSLQRHVGARYVWGGNWPGIPQMLNFYPPKKPLPEASLATWIFQGLDCSGILYLATNGCAPRNTSDLVTFGKSLAIEGKTPHEISLHVKPLDIIVWKGHVLIVLTSNQTIEARHGFGVILCNLEARLQEIMQERKPLNCWDTQHKGFVVNRWI